MTAYSVVTTLEAKSGLPADDFQNSWAFQRPTPALGADATFLGNVLTAFYDDLSGYLGNAIQHVGTSFTHRFYDVTAFLSGGPHGSPVFTRTGVFTAGPSGTEWPTEVCSVLTLRSYPIGSEPPVEAPDGGDPGTAVDRPRQRASGRLFLGPLTSVAGTPDANSSSRPTAPFRDAVLAAANVLNDDAAVGLWTWSVWSRADSSMSGVNHVSMDDAFDTQRRRGPDPTTKTVLVV